MQLSEAMELLTNGMTFLKFGRRGRPKQRHIFLVEKQLSWVEPGAKESHQPPSKKQK